MMRAMRPLRLLSLLLFGTSCGVNGDGVGGGEPLSAACATYQSYVEDTCGLDFTEALAEACESRIRQITTTCSSEEADIWSSSYQTGIVCMEALGYCPGDDLSAEASACQTTHYAEVAELERTCLGYETEGTRVGGDTGGVDGFNGSCTALEPIAYNLEAPASNVVSLFDEQVSDALPLGFTVDWFGTPVDTLWVSSNGFVSVAPTSEGCCDPVALPKPDHLNGLISIAMTDLDPTLGGTIAWELRGEAPNRRFVLDYAADRAYGDGDPDVQAQMVLFEASNLVEIHTTRLSAGSAVTQGIESLDGTEAFCDPDRVQNDISLSLDAVRAHVGG